VILSQLQLQDLVSQNVVVNPRRQVAVELVSIGLHLDSQFLIYDEHPPEAFTPPLSLRTKTVSYGPGETHILPPMGKVLGCSEERVAMPLNVMAFIQTKGSLARGFLMVHMCDGQVDPGYCGKVTFEIVNHSDFYYKLAPGMPIAQMFFMELSSPVPTGYCGRYQESGTATAMRSPKAG